MSLAFGLALPHWYAISGGAFSPASLFAGGTVAGAWYDPSDLTTLFTTSAGTTQCAMPGQGSAVSVGLMLDKSQGLVLGPELITPEANRDFSSDTGYWTKGAGVTISGGAANFSAASGYALYRISVLPVGAPGAYYEVTFTVTNYVSGSIRPYLGTSPTFGTAVSANGTYTQRFCPTSGGEAGFNANVAFTGSIDNVSVKQVLGNHAIAFNDTTARPELRARVNLLTYSEDQSNGVWINYSATQQSNVGTAPDGTNTADRIVEAAGSSLQARYQTLAGGLNISHTVSAYAKADQRNVFNLSYSGVGNTNWFAATFELTGNGSVTKTGAGAAGTYTSSSITPVGNGWYFCTVTGNPGQASTHYAYGGPSDTNNPTYGNFGVLTYSGNTANGVLVWGFDVRPANIGANVPAYQRIADANTYDTSGFPLYLRFDGIDDSMYTPANLNLSGTDKVSVFAGVRKLSDVEGILSELSVNFNSNTGSFIQLPNSSGSGPANTYASASRGTAGATLSQFAVSAATPAPATNVFTATHDISGDLSAIRLNGAASGTNGTGDEGAGNFGSYPLYIGARNNSSLWFNGHLHSLIIAGSAVSAGNISATEQWVANKTGIVIP